MAAFQAIGNQSAGAASVNVAWPAHVTGDLGLLIIETGGEGTTLTPPSPWVAVTGSPRVDLATNAGSKLQIWYKFATSGAEANVATGDSGDHQVARIITFRGVDPTTPFDVTPVTDAKTTASTTVTWPSIVTATDGALIVLVATRPDDSTSVTAFSNPVNANLTDLQERGEAGSNAGHGGGFVVVTGTKTTAGATGTTTMTCPSVTNAEFVIALRPEPVVSTGDLDATETGADTASISGDVIVSGSLSSTETGDDTFAATGDVVVSGALAATEAGDDTFAATGTVTDAAITGTLAATETGDDTFASTASLIVQGSLAATETGTDTFASTGVVVVQGTLAAIETGGDSLAATGTVLVRGSLAATETGDDVFAATGEVADAIAIGSLAATEVGSDTLAATGTVFWTPVTGSLSATETGNDTLSSSGTVLVSGSLAATEVGSDTFAATGTVADAISLGTLAATEAGSDTFAATGTVAFGAETGSLAAQETGDDTLAATGAVRVSGSVSATETALDVFGIYVDPDYVTPGYVETGVSGQVLVSGSLGATEIGQDQASFSGKEIVVQQQQGGGRNIGFRPVAEVTVKLKVSKPAKTGSAKSQPSLSSRNLVSTPAAVAGLPRCKVYKSGGLLVGCTRSGTARPKVCFDFAFTVPVQPASGLSSADVTIVPRIEQYIVAAVQPRTVLRASDARVQTVINPTDDELMAIISLLRQKRQRRFQPMFRR